MAVNDIVMGAAGASGPATYIEDVFSTYLYTGNSSTQTITNGIDLSGKGGMTWIKGRNINGQLNRLVDTNRGAGFSISPNLTSGQTATSGLFSSFNSNGFSLGADTTSGDWNYSSYIYASWSFRKQPKFFDVVTYTGNGVSGRTIAHNLGSVPGVIIVKATSRIGNCVVYHRSIGATASILLDTTAIPVTSGTMWANTEPTSSVFSVGTSTSINQSGQDYVAYVFAHNAGGFGALGTDNVISCGSYTGNGSTTGPVINLGYEPQYLLIKDASGIENWLILDSMRGLTVNTDTQLLANSTNAEYNFNFLNPTATGFNVVSNEARVNTNGNTYIYIAIRRPMKTPMTGTEVFAPNLRTGTSAVATISNIGLTPDLYMVRARNIANDSYIADRLRGTSVSLISQYGFDEASVAASIVNTFNMNGATIPVTGAFNNTSPNTYIDYFMRRAPSFFDEVCYTGTGANTTQAHNLTVAPELWIVKGRSGATAWQVGSTALANTEYLVFNGNDAKATGATRWNSTYPTASVFSLGTATTVNTSAATYVAYLFATLAGVSKVGSYTGNGSSQTINCSFTSGARFVMIKRTNSTGDWYFWDSARGIVAGNDPYSAFNTSFAEVTTDDSVDAASSGFIVNQLAATNINVNAATYIFLAIA